MDEQLEIIRENAEHAGDIHRLIERLIGAAGPDRKLDRAIADVLIGTTVRMAIGGDARYTGSLDAARTVVPSGFYWLVSEGRTRSNEPLGGAQVFRPNYLVEPIAQAEHETAILALCLAALRAREVLVGGAQADG